MDLEEMKFLNDQTNQLYKTQNAEEDKARYQQAAAQAANLYKSGDPMGAVSVMFKADPKLAHQVLSGAVGAYNPNVQGQIAGAKSQAELPAQLAIIDEKGKFNMMKPTANEFKDVNVENPDGTVVKMVFDKKTGQFVSPGQQLKSGFSPSVTKNSYTGSPQLVSKGGVVKGLSEEGAPIEQDSQGNNVVLTPKAVDVISKDTETWNKDSKDLIGQINSLDTARQAIIKNTPGAAMLEKMRLIRGMTPRPAVQEVMALNYGGGWETTMESYANKAAGQGLGPQEQTNFLNMVNTFQNANLNQYNELLHSRAAQTAAKLKQGNTEMDPSIVMKRMLPTAPTPVQKFMQNYQKMAPEDQKMVDQANQYLLTHTRNDPDWNDALKVLQMHINPSQ